MTVIDLKIGDTIIWDSHRETLAVRYTSLETDDVSLYFESGLSMSLSRYLTVEQSG